MTTHETEALIEAMRIGPKSIGGVFAEGFRDWVALVEDALPEGTPKEVVRRRALTLVCATVGSVAVARTSVLERLRKSGRTVKHGKLM